MRERTSSGSTASEAAVKPTRSQKRTVTTLRSSWIEAAGCSVRGAVQKPQNWKPFGFSLPQAGQVSTSRVEGAGHLGERRGRKASRKRTGATGLKAAAST